MTYSCPENKYFSENNDVNYWISVEKREKQCIFDIRQRTSDIFVTTSVIVSTCIFIWILCYARFNGGRSNFDPLFIALLILSIPIALASGIAWLFSGVTYFIIPKRSIFSIDKNNISKINYKTKMVQYSINIYSITSMYVRYSNSKTSNTVTFTGGGVAGTAVAGAIGVAQAVNSLASINTAAIFIHYNGKRVCLISHLSDDEADYVLQKICSASGMQLH